MSKELVAIRPEVKAIDGSDRSDACVGDQDIEPSVGADERILENLGHLPGVGHVHREGCRPLRPGGTVNPGSHVLRALGVQVGDNHVGALRGQPLGDDLADAAGCPGYQGHLPGQFLFRWGQGQLVQLQGPVFGIVGVFGGQGGIVADRLGGAQHVNGVVVNVVGY